MSRNGMRHPVQVQGWRSGLTNLWRKEQQQWWGNGNWLKQSIIWLLLLNGFYTIMLLALTHVGNMAAGMGTESAGLVFIVSFLALFINVGTVIQAQGAILDEKLRGTVAWILSKPVSRSAFVLAKCAPLPGMLLLIVLVPGLVAVLQLSLALGQMLPLVTMVLLVGWLAASLLFYFCLTLLLGTVFNSRAPVIGIALLMVMLVSQLAQQLPPALVAQHFLPPILMELALIGGAALCLLGAILRFTREEF